MKSGKFSIRFATILFVLIMLIGCGQDTNTSGNSNEQDSNKEKAGGELKVASESQPPVLDTHLSQGQAVANMVTPMHETLLTTNSNAEIKPMLADSWEVSEDGKTITFKLREGVLFHNGKEMTADDVVASMERWIDISSPGQDYFAGATLEKVDDYTVKLLMTGPNSTALTILAYGGGGYPAIMPKKVIENAEDTGVTEYIGTGPFKFVEWKQDQYLHYTRFKDYSIRDEESDGASGARKALVDDIYFHFITDTSTRVAGLLSGEYDIAMQIPTTDVDQLEQDSNITLYTAEDGKLEFYFNKRKGLFTDRNAREAVVRALDMNAIMLGSFDSEEFYVLNHNLMMKGQENLWSSKHGKDIYNQNNIEEAKKLLSQTDYNGEELVLLTQREVDHMYNSTVVLQQQLKELGINSRLEVVDRATYEDLRGNEDGFDIFMVTNVPRPEPTSSTFLRSNFGGWTEDPKKDAIIKKFREQKSLDDAIPVFDELQEWFFDYLPIIQVGDKKRIDGTRSHVENYQYRDSLILWNVELTK